MPENDFLPWAVASGANTLTQSEYAANSTRGTGAVNGVADPLSFNNGLRQATSMASMLGSFMAANGQPALDNGTLSSLLSGFIAALENQLPLGNYLPLTGGTVTGELLVEGEIVSGNSGISTSGNLGVGGVIEVVAGLGVTGGDASISGSLSIGGPLVIGGGTPIRDSDFANTLAGAGSYALPGGFLLQWGTNNSANGSGAVITFPTAFPNACFGVLATNTVLSSENHVNTSVIDKTSFRLSNSPTGSFTDAAFWVALGN